jgi:hypothetical protein
MNVIVSFQDWSLKTPADNMKEVYLNRHIEGESFRVSVKDKNAVEIIHFKADAKIYANEFEHSTVYESKNDDVPRIYFRVS